MTMEEAKKITAEVYRWCAGHVFGEPPKTPPPDYPLRDMLEAAQMVRGYTEPGEEPGRIRRFATCDDRLIAAMYVLGSYGADPPGETNPILRGGGRMVLVVKTDA